MIAEILIRNAEGMSALSAHMDHYVLAAMNIPAYLARLMRLTGVTILMAK